MTGAMAAQAIYNLQSIYAAAEERESADGADTDGSGVTRAQCAVILSRCARLLARYAG
ncbi:MAG: hypothetical protein LIO52_01030 [Oscillospiraceae bacterium]|nr:hypothetical protein [Oscillospiraceae bacterium]